MKNRGNEFRDLINCTCSGRKKPEVFSQNAGMSEFTDPAPSVLLHTSRATKYFVFASGANDGLTVRGDMNIRLIAINISMPVSFMVLYFAPTNKWLSTQHLS